MARSLRTGRGNDDSAGITPEVTVVLEKIDLDFFGIAEIDSIEAFFSDLVDAALSGDAPGGPTIAGSGQFALHGADVPQSKLPPR